MAGSLCRPLGVVCVYDENCLGLEVYAWLLDCFVWHEAMNVRCLGQGTHY